jgi:hypothetical protein
VESALTGCSQVAGVRRRVAWAVLDRPALLTGSGVDAPTPAVLRFIDALADAGSISIVRPACARCERVLKLPGTLNGKRVCGDCVAISHATDCHRCGKRRTRFVRDDSGVLVCGVCWEADRLGREPCTGCRRRRPVAARTGEGPWCKACKPRENQLCSVCGKSRRCEVSRATGKPCCANCRANYARCSACGIVAPIRGGTRAVPLCAPCVNPDPEFWDRCSVCNRTWQLNTLPCQRCAIDRRLRELLSRSGEDLPDAFVPFRDAVVGAERPDHVMVWLSKPKVRQLLTLIGQDQRPISHDLLDELDGGKTLRYLRAVLVGSGVLPARDEVLARLERWIGSVIGGRADAQERRILHGYTVWHHLRRLRSRLDGNAAVSSQERHMRCIVTAATELLDYLNDHASTLAACTQSDLDDFLANVATYPDDSSAFVRWAQRNKYVGQLAAPASRWAGPTGPHDEQARWETARRLLHDGDLPIADRVAGLLVVLYAQKVVTISQLTVDQIERDGDSLTIRLGRSPIVLPPPMNRLMVELLESRRASTLLDSPGSWMFPGRNPGRPISDAQLSKRLRAVGVDRQRRNTALFSLAAEVPSAVLARMLGIHIQVAVQWQRASAGDWNSYAADVATRTPGDVRDSADRAQR